MICTMNVQKGYNVCCRRQNFEEIRANLSLKVLIFVFSIPKFSLKSWIPPFIFENLPPPFRFPHPKNFFRFPPF